MKEYNALTSAQQVGLVTRLQGHWKAWMAFCDKNMESDNWDVLRADYGFPIKCASGKEYKARIIWSQFDEGVAIAVKLETVFVKVTRFCGRNCGCADWGNLSKELYNWCKEN